MSEPHPGVPRSAWTATGVATGAALGAMGISPWLAVSAGGASLAAALVATGRSERRLGGILVALAMGLLVVAGRLLAGPVPGVPPSLPADSGGPWTAVVESVGSPRSGSQVARLRLETDAGGVIVAATLPGYPEIRADDVIVVGGRLRPPPADDPYGAYLVRSGASGTLDGRSLEIIRAGQGASVQSARDAAGDALEAALPEPEAGLAAAILVGLRERVDRDLATAFATAGVSHIVAISGWNIAIVAGIVGALLRGRARRRLVTLVVGATIAGYVVAAGASPSVVRAAVMASVVLLARETGRAGRAPGALAWAATILLLLDPAMIADAGFRLSVAATAGLLAWGTSLGHRIGRVAGGRVPGWLAESLGISLAAQLATLPDVLATFGRLSLVAPAVNLLVVPLVPVAMAGGVVAMAGGALTAAGAPSALAILAGLPGWLVLHLIVAIVRIGAAVPMAAIAVPEPLAIPTGLAAAGIIAILLGVRRHRRRAAQHGRADHARRPAVRPPDHRRRLPHIGLPPMGTPARAVLVASLIIASIGASVVAGAATRATRLTVLDVGQGDAILLESRTGARMLVDGGPDPGRLMVLLDERIPPWDRRLDVVVLSHPHEDHVAGLVRVLARYDVGRVYEPGMHGPGPGWQAWDRSLRRGSPPRGTLSTGQRIVLGEITLSVLWPDPGAVPLEPGATGRIINDTSIVLLGQANGRRFLLPGDAEDDVDPMLVRRGLPHVDLLKVAHHGSATATSQALLDAVHPSVAVVSVGAHNDYGHPAPATLARLQASGARVYRTDQDGSVAIDLGADGLVVRTAGGRTAAIDPHTGYDRGRDDPRPIPGRPLAFLPGAAAVVPAPRVRGGRRGRVAGGPSGGERLRGRPAAGRDRRAAPRRRQAPISRCSRPPPARHGLGGVADGSWLGGARAGGARPPGDAPGRARL